MFSEQTFDPYVYILEIDYSLNWTFFDIVSGHKNLLYHIYQSLTVIVFLTMGPSPPPPGGCESEEGRWVRGEHYVQQIGIVDDC